jgi:hypothetical protein
MCMYAWIHVLCMCVYASIVFVKISVVAFEELHSSWRVRGSRSRIRIWVYTDFHRHVFHACVLHDCSFVAQRIKHIQERDWAHTREGLSTYKKGIEHIQERDKISTYERVKKKILQACISQAYTYTRIDTAMRNSSLALPSKVYHCHACTRLEILIVYMRVCTRTKAICTYRRGCICLYTKVYACVDTFQRYDYVPI